MKLLHFSDIHLWRRAFDWSDPVFKRWLGLANLLLRRGRKFPRALAREVVEHIAAAEADAVIFSGDMTTTALRAEFEDVRDLFVPLVRKWGERFIILPGNHDRYTRRTVAREYYERQFPSARFADPLRPMQKVALSRSLTLLSFDCSVPRMLTSRGRVTPTLARALDEELQRQEQAGAAVVLIGHYPYAAPPGMTIKAEHRLEGDALLAEVVARRKPVLYLHGHKHHRWAFHPARTPDTLCVNAGPASCSSADAHRRAGYLVIELDAANRPVRVEARVAAPWREFSLWPAQI